MSICRARLRNTSNTLTLRMSSEQVRLQASPKSFGINSWMPQIIRQWIPDSWSDDRKCTGLKGAAANSRNWHLVTSGRLQVLATSNFREVEQFACRLTTRHNSVPSSGNSEQYCLVGKDHGALWLFVSGAPNSYLLTLLTYLLTYLLRMLVTSWPWLLIL